MSPKNILQVYANHEDEREEEALSLCDLPITNVVPENDEDQSQFKGDDIDFDFGSLVGSVAALESEMCSADEVFSGGQILPFRHSVSSEARLPVRHRNSSWRSVSRSESMDRSGSCSRSSSTRSSSIRSQYSTTSSSSTLSAASNRTSNTVKTLPLSKTKVRNNFHSHPSPKPQIWASGAQTTTHTPPIGKKSTMWDVLKLGLVRTPEIELQDRMQRHRTSTSSKPFILPRNSSTNSNSSISSINNYPIKGGSTISDLKLDLQKKKSHPQSKGNSGGGFFKSCKCSVMVIEPLPTREFGLNNFGTEVSVGPKMSSSGKNIQVNLNEDKSLEQRVNVRAEQQQGKKDKQLRQGKVMSHHRTFEWLRDISHANVLHT